MVAAEVHPRPNRAKEAALALQRLGFRILHVGPTISVQASQSTWETIFNVSFEPQTRTVIAEPEKGGEIVYNKAATARMRIPSELRDLVEDVMFVEPPEFF